MFGGCSLGHRRAFALSEAAASSEMATMAEDPEPEGGRNANSSRSAVLYERPKEAGNSLRLSMLTIRLHRSHHTRICRSLRGFLRYLGPDQGQSQQRVKDKQGRSRRGHRFSKRKFTNANRIQPTGVQSKGARSMVLVSRPQLLRANGRTGSHQTSTIRRWQQSACEAIFKSSVMAQGRTRAALPRRGCMAPGSRTGERGRQAFR